MKLYLKKNGLYKINPLLTNKKDLETLEKNLILVFAGVRPKSNTANDIAKTYVKQLQKNKKKNINEIIEHARIAKKLILNKNFYDFGLLLDETWKVKKNLSSSVSNFRLNEIYNFAIKNGAIGGKLLGAGGSGFFLFYVPEKKRNNFIKKFKNYVTVPFKFEKNGTKIIFNDNIN